MRVKLALGVTVLAAGIAAAEAPNWFKTAKHPQYPIQLYFVGVGSGESYEAAGNHALADIARQIEVKIDAEVINIVTSHQAGDREQIDAELKFRIRSGIDTNLKGAQVVERAMDDETNYVLCALQKDQFLNGLEYELDRLKGDLQQAYSRSDSLLNMGRPFQGLDLLLETSDQATEFFARTALHSALSEFPYDQSGVISGPELISRARSALGGIELELASGGDQSAKNGFLMPEPIKIKASYRTAAGSKPLAGIKLSLRGEHDRVIERRYTDRSGVAEFWIYADGDNVVTLNVGLDFSRVPAILRPDLRRLNVPVRYSILPTPPMNLSVQINRENGKRSESIENTIAKHVTRVGHLVSDSAPFRLTGEVELVDTRQVDGIAGVEYIAESSLTLYLKIVETGESIGSVTITATGMDSQSEIAATRKSHQNFKVTSRDMSRLLASAGVKLEKAGERLSNRALAAGKTAYEAGDLDEALRNLARVTAGYKNLQVSRTLIEKIKERQAEDARLESENK